MNLRIENRIMGMDIFLEQRTCLQPVIIINLYIQPVHQKFTPKQVWANFKLSHQTYRLELPPEPKFLKQKLEQVLRLCTHLASTGFANTNTINTTSVSGNKLHFSI